MYNMQGEMRLVAVRVGHTPLVYHVVARVRERWLTPMLGRGDDPPPYQLRNLEKRALYLTWTI